MILPQGCCNRRILFIHLHCSPSKILFSTYSKLPLIKSDSVSVHQRNLQLLLIEIYKTINNLNSFFMAEVFATNVLPYNLRGSTNLVLSNARTNLYGIATVRIFGQNYGRLCRRKSKSPRNWRSSKEILRPYLFIAAPNDANVLLQI